MADLLKPGDLPRPLTRKERQRLARIDHAGLAYQRPDHDAEEMPTVDACELSRFKQHRFVRSQGVMVCEFCQRTEANCRRPQ